MEYSYFSLGFIGGWEALMILMVMTLVPGAVVGVVLLTLWLSKRHNTPTQPATHPASTVKLATCPRCGVPLPPNAPQGLCPRCVLQVGIETQDASNPAFKDAAGKPNPPDPAELAKHFPQLEILELLGQGGMGAVYKARQKELDRMVALKVLPGGTEGDPAFAERFMREARALAKLNHPNIVAVHDFGQLGGGTGLQPVSGSGEAAAGRNTDRRSVPLYYFIMEFIDGPNLRQLMHGQKLAPREAMTIVPKICEALQFAHDEGIVHRDIKPENILLDTKGRVKIADFGIAKIAGKSREAGLTGVKDVIGTPHYMAPEQVEHPTEVDHRADIYSLGVVFYEMLTGELPLGKFDVPSHKVQVDVRLDEVVLHTLEKEPGRRYQHVSEVKTDVETIAAGAAKSGFRSQNAEVERGVLALPEPSHDAHFSRVAIVGACWAPLFFITLLTLFTVRMAALPDGGAPTGPAWWQIGLSFTLFPLGLAAPFGTTICGVIALSQIRRSCGGLCGLGLALFDALLFPLLVLDGLILWLVYLLLNQSLVWVGFKPGTEVALETALLPAALIVIVVNVWLVRSAWRSAKRMTGRIPTAGERAAATTWAKVAIPVSVILLLGAAGLMVASPLTAKRRADALKTQQQAALREAGVQAGEEADQSVPEVADPASDFTQVPPVVVRTQPESGSRAVDPSLTEVRVTFSKPMEPGRSAWVDVGNGPLPGPPGTRFLEGGLTCVRQVKLKPGKTYAVWINHEKYPAFQDTEGRAAVPYLLVFKTKDSDATTSGGTAVNTPDLVTVGQDGSAQFTSVQEAINAVAEEGTVRVGRGRYSESLEIHKPVRLIGAGWEQSVIGPAKAWEPPSSEHMMEMQRTFEAAQSDAERARLRVEFMRKIQPPVAFIRTTGDVFVEGLKFTQPGVAPEGKLLSGAVIEVRGTELRMNDCAVLGSPASGIVLTDGARADIRNTLIAAAWNRGVDISDDSHAVIKDCDIRNCHYAGVTIKGGAEAAIERCRISGAAWHGIRYDDASPRIEGNLIYGNARCGVYASGKTAAQVGNNVFFNNEMSGLSCWFENQDVIGGNTFANNEREALAILGASAPTVTSNIFSGQPVALVQGHINDETNTSSLGTPLVVRNLFWNNGTNWVRWAQPKTKGVASVEIIELDSATESLLEDAGFKNAGREDFALAPGSVARREGIGVADPLLFASPWPLQPEEKAIIPNDDTRDSRQWKRPEE